MSDVKRKPTLMTKSNWMAEHSTEKVSLIGRLIGFCLENKLVVALFVVFVVGWGIMVAPFDWDLGGLPRNPVPVDAIPDIGENQQIVFTEWMGRSPQDVEDQITYPLTVSLLGIPGVKTVRSYSFFGFSRAISTFTGHGAGSLRNSTACRLVLCPPRFSRPWGLMLRLWARFSGTHSKAGARMVILRAGGIWMICARYRTGTCVIRSCPRRV